MAAPTTSRSSWSRPSSIRCGCPSTRISNPSRVTDILAVMRHLVLLAVLVGACGGDDDDCVDRSSADPGYMHKDGQGTYAGQSCLESNCHLDGHLGAQAPAFAVGGTVFQADRTTPQAGASVRF